MHALIPKMLTKGDVIGLVAPASPVADETRIHKAVQYFESLGYRVEVGKNVGRSLGYLAGTDDERLADLHAMFSAKRVKAIMALRGGYGTPRLLQSLKYALIARNPKILCGFSDLTALQLAIWKVTRLVTFHGPMAAVDFGGEIDRYTEQMFWQTISSPARPLPIAFSSEVVARTKSVVRGRLLGGNLSLIISIMGTPFQPEFRNSLLFLEEIGEEPYRVDRMLAQLRNSGLLAQVNGLLIGQFTDCKPTDVTKPSLTSDQVLDELVVRLKKPVLRGLPFGHVAAKMTLPIGLRAELDTSKRTLRFLDTPVLQQRR